MSCVYFEIFYFELLDPEILSAASSVLHPLSVEWITSMFFRYRYCTTRVTVLHNFLNLYQYDYLRTF